MVRLFPVQFRRRSRDGRHEETEHGRQRVMGRAPRELTPQESELHFFGAELRHWRTVRELSHARLGLLTHDSGALIGKIEKGERFPTFVFAQRMDEALATAGYRTALGWLTLVACSLAA